MSQRRKVRLKRRLPAHFDCGGLPVHGIIRNFSEIGVFVQTNNMLPIGSAIQLRCAIENETHQKEEVVLDGRIVSVRNDPMMRLSNTGSSGGMGVEIAAIPATFERYVARLRSQSGQELEEPVVTQRPKAKPSVASVAPAAPESHYVFSRQLPNSGDLGSGTSEFLVPDILIALWRQGFSGMLNLSRGILKKTIYLKKGQPAYIESLLDSEKLGDYLIRRGALTAEDLGIALKAQEGVVRPIGQILIDRGFIDSTALFEALSGQQEQKLIGSFPWFDGHFQISQMVEWPEQVPVFSLRLHAILFQGLSKWFDAPVIRYLISTDEATIIKKLKPIEPEIQVPPKLARFFNALPPETSLLKLLSDEAMGLDEVLPPLFSLMLYGWVGTSAGSKR